MLMRHERAAVVQLGSVAAMFTVGGFGAALGFCGHEWWAAGLMFISLQLPIVGRVVSRHVWPEA